MCIVNVVTVLYNSKKPLRANPIPKQGKMSTIRRFNSFCLRQGHDPSLIISNSKTYYINEKRTGCTFSKSTDLYKMEPDLTSGFYGNNAINKCNWIH